MPFFFAYDEGRLIGAARAISDGVTYSAAYDVMVLPELSRSLCRFGGTAAMAEGTMQNVVLETERMTLRRMDFGDVDDLLGIFSDPEAMRFYPGTKSAEEARGWIQWNRNNYDRYGFGLWIATLKETGAFAGQCGLVVQQVDGREEVEIGYLFLRRLWNQGLATEAALACRDYGREQLGLDRLISLIDPSNAASRRVAEKIGMRLEREIVKWDKPICVYALGVR